MAALLFARRRQSWHESTRRADFSRMTDEEVVRVAEEGSEDAYNYLLRKYEKLVYIWTRPYFLQGAEDDDLLQEGMIGLYKAIRDFSPGSSSFWSFAKLCIVRNVISAIKGHDEPKAHSSEPVHVTAQAGVRRRRGPHLDGGFDQQQGGRP